MKKSHVINIGKQVLHLTRIPTKASADEEGLVIAACRDRKVRVFSIRPPFKLRYQFQTKYDDLLRVEYLDAIDGIVSLEVASDPQGQTSMVRRVVLYEQWRASFLPLPDALVSPTKWKANQEGELVVTVFSRQGIPKGGFLELIFPKLFPYPQTRNAWLDAIGSETLTERLTVKVSGHRVRLWREKGVVPAGLVRLTIDRITNPPHFGHTRCFEVYLCEPNGKRREGMDNVRGIKIQAKKTQIIVDDGGNSTSWNRPFRFVKNKPPDGPKLQEFTELSTPSVQCVDVTAKDARVTCFGICGDTGVIAAAYFHHRQTVGLFACLPEFRRPFNGILKRKQSKLLPPLPILEVESAFIISQVRFYHGYLAFSSTIEARLLFLDLQTTEGGYDQSDDDLGNIHSDMGPEIIDPNATPVEQVDVQFDPMGRPSMKNHSSCFINLPSVISSGDSGIGSSRRLGALNDSAALRRERKLKRQYPFELVGHTYDASHRITIPRSQDLSAGLEDDVPREMQIDVCACVAIVHRRFYSSSDRIMVMELFAGPPEPRRPPPSLVHLDPKQKPFLRSKKKMFHSGALPARFFFATADQGFLYDTTTARPIFTYVFPETIVDITIVSELLIVLTRNAIECHTIARMDERSNVGTKAVVLWRHSISQRQCGLTALVDPTFPFSILLFLHPNAQSPWLRHLPGCSEIGTQEDLYVPTRLPSQKDVFELREQRSVCFNGFDKDGVSSNVNIKSVQILGVIGESAPNIAQNLRDRAQLEATKGVHVYALGLLFDALVMLRSHEKMIKNTEPELQSLINSCHEQTAMSLLSIQSFDDAVTHFVLSNLSPQKVRELFVEKMKSHTEREARRYPDVLCAYYALVLASGAMKKKSSASKIDITGSLVGDILDHFSQHQPLAYSTVLLDKQVFFWDGLVPSDCLKALDLCIAMDEAREKNSCDSSTITMRTLPFGHDPIASGMTDLPAESYKDKGVQSNWTDHFARTLLLIRLGKNIRAYDTLKDIPKIDLGKLCRTYHVFWTHWSESAVLRDHILRIIPWLFPRILFDYWRRQDTEMDCVQLASNLTHRSPVFYNPEPLHCFLEACIRLMLDQEDDMGKDNKQELIDAAMLLIGAYLERISNLSAGHSSVMDQMTHRHRWTSKYPYASKARPAWLDKLLTIKDGNRDSLTQTHAYAASSVDNEREFLLSRIHALVALVELEWEEVKFLIDSCPPLSGLQKDSVLLLFLASHTSPDRKVEMERLRLVLDELVDKYSLIISSFCEIELGSDQEKWVEALTRVEKLARLEDSSNDGVYTRVYMELLELMVPRIPPSCFLASLPADGNIHRFIRLIDKNFQAAEASNERTKILQKVREAEVQPDLVPELSTPALSLQKAGTSTISARSQFVS